MMPDFDLSPKQTQVLAALLAGETVSAAARDHQIHRSTIHDWIRRDSRFGSALEQGREYLQTRLFDDIQDLAALALDRIRQLLADPNTAPAVVLRAATLILKMATVAPAHQDPSPEPASERTQDQPIRQNPAPETNRTLRYATKPPGRNEPCFCGSGKKYKHCCLEQGGPPLA
ncbi:MAG: SEC-C metal-binding domain-containing protein [Bryobacteraceae bacterium]